MGRTAVLIVVVAFVCTLVSAAHDVRPGEQPRLVAAATSVGGAGALDVAADGSGFDAALVPGAVRGADVLLTARTSLDHASLAGEVSGALAPRLTIRVADDRGVVYDGPLGGLGTVPLRAFEPGERRRYRMTVAFPDGGVPRDGVSGDNELQGAIASVRLRWSADASAPQTAPSRAAVPSTVDHASRTGAPPRVRILRSSRRDGRRRIRRVVRVEATCGERCRVGAWLVRRRPGSPASAVVSSVKRSTSRPRRLVLILRPPARTTGPAVRTVTVRGEVRDASGRIDRVSRVVRVRYAGGR